MRIVQALHWLRDTMGQVDEDQVLIRRLTALLNDPTKGKRLRDDLEDGLTTLPSWMQSLLRPILAEQAGAT